MAAPVMRRKRHDNPKPPSVSDTEYFSGDQTYPTKRPLSTTGDAHSSSSEQYPSEADSAVEESDSPASGSTLPPRSPATRFSGELKVPDETEVSDAVSERAWYEFDFTVVLALLSPITNWLTGSDFIKNILLVTLLVFYLHQIIEVPWSLYLASRPRRSLHGLPQDYTSNPNEHHRVALSELHMLEIFYLILSILSPFLGAILLRTVVVSFSGQSTVSWFSLSLFVLATGMRPWKHGIQRLRERTTDLHTTVHYPPSDAQKVQALIDRVAQLEAELKSLRRQSKSFNSDMYEHVEDAIEMMEIASRRHEKKADVSKAFVEGRLTKLEQNVESLLERMEIRADQPALSRVMAQIFTLTSTLIEQLYPILPTWIVIRFRGNAVRSPRASPKMGRPRTSIKLETIPEVAAFQPKNSAQSSRYLNIPSLGLGLRIGDLVMLPLRWIIAYLIPSQIYTPRTHAPLS